MRQDHRRVIKIDRLPILEFRQFLRSGQIHPQQGQVRFVQLKHVLIEAFAPQLVDRLRALPENGRADPDLDRRIEACQLRAETQALTERRRMLGYDTWLDEVLTELAKRD